MNNTERCAPEIMKILLSRDVIPKISFLLVSDELVYRSSNDENFLKLILTLIR